MVIIDIVSKPPEPAVRSMYRKIAVLLGILLCFVWAGLPAEVIRLYRLGFWQAWIYNIEHGYDVLFVTSIFLCPMLVIGAWYLLPVLTARRKSVGVFISYNHLNEEDATLLASTLSKAGFVIHFNPMRSRTQDEIVDVIRDQLRRTDAVLAIPGRARDSFANAEILSAATLSKPVVIVVLPNQEYLPHTALSGYPVFYQQFLTCKNFDPLVVFLRVLFNHVDAWNRDKTERIVLGHALLRHIVSWHSYYPHKIRRKWFAILLLALAICLMIAIIVSSVADLLYAFADVELGTYYGYLITVLFIVILSASVILAIIKAVAYRSHLRKVVRQSTGKRQFAFDVAADLFDDEVRCCMASEPLPLMPDVPIVPSQQHNENGSGGEHAIADALKHSDQ